MQNWPLGALFETERRKEEDGRFLVAGDQMYDPQRPTWLIRGQDWTAHRLLRYCSTVNPAV